MPLIDGPTVHAVTDTEVLRRPGFLAMASAVFRALGPNVAIHLRGPGLSGRLLFDLAGALAPFQESTGGWLIVNDRLDIASDTGARGVQLPSHGLKIDDARAVAPRAKVGVSVHSGADARTAAASRADWIVAGNVFTTTTHPGRPEGGVELVKAVVTAGVPTIMIGGIRPRDVPGLRALGVHGVATISGIWNAPDPAAAAEAYSRSFQAPF